jgi:hypothetical protein
LNPDAFKPEVINAFHPDYIKTYHPDLLKQIKSDAMYKKKGEELSKHVDKVRETKPSHGTVFGISENAISVSPKEMMTKRREFHTYAKAGMPKKGKKK